MVKTLLKRGVVTGAAVIGLEAAYAVLRPSPELEQFDPSDSFGDPSSPPFRLTAMGDSSITAPGVQSPDQIWVSLICARLARTHHVTLTSLAVGGSTAQDLLADQLEPAIHSKPDMVLVSVGANDVIKGVPSRVFASQLDRLVGDLANTGTTVVQSGVGYLETIPRLYPPLSTMVARRAARFHAIHHDVAAAHGTHVAGLRSDDPSIWNRDRSLWAADYFHVSPAGHARWAESAWKTVGPLVDAENQSS